MSTPEERITALFQAAKAKPVFEVSADDAKAYNGDIVSRVFKEHFAQRRRGLRDQIKELPSRLARVELMASTNLYEIHKVAQENIAAARAAGVDDATMHALITEAEESCRPQAMSFTHSAKWDGSAYKNERGEAGIRKSKMLKAPSELNPDEHDNERMIFVGVEPRGMTNPRVPPYFKVDAKDEDMHRSMPVLMLHTSDFYQNEHLAVGGNQMHEAWVMTTVSNMLSVMVGKQSSREAIMANPQGNGPDRARSVVSEILVPHTLSVAGGKFVSGSKVEELDKPRAAPRKPTKPTSIKPTEDNPDLKRTGRSRRKTDE